MGEAALETDLSRLMEKKMMDLGVPAALAQCAVTEVILLPQIYYRSKQSV